MLRNDGFESVGFFANGQLKTIDTTGGPVHTICSVPGGSTNGFDGAWNRDGIILFSSTSTEGLQRVSAEGGIPTSITTVDQSRGENGHYTPRFLPDGKHYFYVIRGAIAANDGLFAGSLDSKVQKKVLDTTVKVEFVSQGYLLFLRDGALFAQEFDAASLQLRSQPVRVTDSVAANETNGRAAFTASDAGVLVFGKGDASSQLDLSWYDRTGKWLNSVGVFPYRGIDLSPDGKQLAAHRHDDLTQTGDVWITDLDRGTSSRFTTDASQDNSSPVWSPDGATIAFASLRNGQWGIYQKSADRIGNDELLYESSTPKDPASWTADGKAILFEGAEPAGSWNMWILPRYGNHKPSPYLESQFAESSGQITHDGRWIAYQSNESGRDEVYVESYPNHGSKLLISRDGGVLPRWRKDGKEIFFIHSGVLLSVDLELSGTQLNAGAPKTLFNARYSSTGHRTNYALYAVSADGQRFLIPRTQGNAADSNVAAQPLTVVLNWTSMLKK